MYVDVSYDINNVIQINEDKNYIKLMYSLHKSWYNSFLTYRNLKKDQENYVFQDDKDMIWTPSIETINMEARDKCKQTEKSEIFKVIPNKETVYKIKSYLKFSKYFFETVNFESLITDCL